MFEVAPEMEIEETGTTFEENAILKAEALAKELGTIVIADDSGLAVDALNGDPGVYSARYAGDHDDEANMIKLLENLQGVEDDKRSARFAAVLQLQDLILQQQRYLAHVKVSLPMKSVERMALAMIQSFRTKLKSYDGSAFTRGKRLYFSPWQCHPQVKGAITKSYQIRGDIHENTCYERYTW